MIDKKIDGKEGEELKKTYNHCPRKPKDIMKGTEVS